MKWSEDLTNFLYWTVTARMIPLAFVGNDNVMSMRDLLSLVRSSLHSEDYNSIEEKMVKITLLDSLIVSHSFRQYKIYCYF